ncbi:hypothetical protein CRG98_004840 [Punica granatum]|uniref:Uncharacterized protein n=1 Tax=Punica granatum TaxID=22663 RepID=A0A2I0L284_PUNGR|nr:hypothetical protein CRG98_004840 [Punica granatum]
MAQPQQPRLNPKPWLGRIKPRLLPMASGSKGLGTFGTVHERLGPSLRSPRSPTLHRAVVGVIVPTSFPPSCRCRCSWVFVAHHV